jgi:gas vesicle protein
MTNGNGITFTVGLLCGVAMGAALGVLLAPKAGSATRRDLAQSAEGLRQSGQDIYDSAAETAAAVSDTVSDLADRGVEFVSDATQQAKKRSKSSHIG